MQTVEKQRPIGYSQAKKAAVDLLNNASLPPLEQDLLFEELASSLLTDFAKQQLVINLGIDYKNHPLRMHSFHPDDSYAYLKSRFYAGSDGLNPAERVGIELFHLGWIDPSGGPVYFEITTIQNPNTNQVEVKIGNNERTFDYTDTFEKEVLIKN